MTVIKWVASNKNKQCQIGASGIEQAQVAWIKNEWQWVGANCAK
jgi:hypothetical protein